MLCWFHRFRFHKEVTLETFRTTIVASHSKHSSQVFLLTFLVCVEKRHITFATAPEHIILSAQFDGCINSVLNLNYCTSHNIELRISTCTISITLMSEHICRSPQKSDVRILLHLLQRIICDSFHASLVFLHIVTVFDKVYIVETEIVDSKFVHKLKTGIHLVLCTLQHVGRLIPLVETGLTAKLVCTRTTQCVPPCDGKLKPVFHLLAQNHTFWFVIMECHQILAVWSLKRNFSCKSKVLFHNVFIV